MYKHLLIEKPNKYEFISVLANLSSYLYQSLDDINWVGFYLYSNDNLYLGPFMGSVACTHININKGVCGKCARDKESIIVDDTHLFKGHIACDARSRSEIVIPLIIDNNLVALLDIDSPKIARFNEKDKLYFQGLIKDLSESIDYKKIKF